MVGIGAQFESPLPILDVIRLEGTYTDFDELQVTSTSNDSTHTRKGDAELFTFSISVAHSF